MSTSWPNDADGDVLRRMQASGFDFQKEIDIDFNVDFDHWPPSEQLIRRLQEQYAKVKVYPSDSGGRGYITFVVHTKLTYELVMFIQSAVSELAAPFGGVCESWGVLH